MITISLCMIVKNEEKVLARCLDTIADLVDEIIIVDTGSSDRTPGCFTILSGRMISAPRETLLFPRPRRNISIQRTRMRYCPKKTGSAFEF